MAESKKKGKVEDAAEKTGEVVGKVGKAGWGAVKGFGKGIKKGVSKKEKKWISIFFLIIIEFFDFKLLLRKSERLGFQILFTIKPWYIFYDSNKKSL